MRKARHLDRRLSAVEDYVLRDYAAVLNLYDEIRLEIGCGKGGFICSMAGKDRNVLFIGLEREPSAVLKAMERAKELELENVRYIISDAKELISFPKGSLSRIYLNFSDPWPRRGHFKRRLTYREFLKIYGDLLKPEGLLELKTDNTGLFEFSQGELSESGWEIIESSDNSPPGEFQTEYETRFREMGISIHKLSARSVRV